MNLPMPVICECGFNTMDAKRAYQHALEHEKGKCPNCEGVGTTEVGNNVVVCCVCKGSGKCPPSCFECEYHLYDFGSGELGCTIKHS